MDALKAIIAKQKEQATALPRSGSVRYFRQGDLEAQRRQQKDKEEAEAAAKKRSQEVAHLVELQERIKAKRFQPAATKQEEEATSNTGMCTQPTAAAALECFFCCSAAVPREEDQEPPITEAEVFRRLRKLKHPITLFGETPWKRYCRLCALELQVLDDEMTEGQQNVFHALQREGEDDDEFEEESKAEGNTAEHAPADSHDAQEGQKPVDSSKEGVIIEWTRRMLSLWEEELKQRSEEEKSTPEGRYQTTLHRQTKKDLKPLLRKLKHKELESDICDRLHEIVQLCGERKYRDAHGA
ncbi:hypothetical protein Esti_001714 [Eimeria stiedai]